MPNDHKDDFWNSPHSLFQESFLGAYCQVQSYSCTLNILSYLTSYGEKITYKFSNYILLI